MIDDHINDKVQIVNFLLTRRCNLQCSYCGIVKDHLEYPTLDYLRRNEISTERVLDFLKRLKIHNPNAFVLWYGGEPTLRKDLYEIIKYCHDNEINYSIISNCTGFAIEKLTDLIDKLGYLQGLTASIDPLPFNKEGCDDDSEIKTNDGFNFLVKYKDKIKDPVAEITVDKYNIDFLYDLVKKLTNEGINSDITFIDVAKNQYYDFSNIRDKSYLVNPDEKVRGIIQRIIDEKLDVHMRDTVLPKILDILPSKLDCELDVYYHNMTVDADGAIRLCLRIRGIKTTLLSDETIFDNYGNLCPAIIQFVREDLNKMCQGCNWPCILFSKETSEHKDLVDDLLHSNKR